MTITVVLFASLVALFVPRAQPAFPADVARLLDPSVDPCVDFYQYACGGWLKNTTLPSDRQAVSYSFTTVSDRSDKIIQAIAKEDESLVGDLWASCMAVDTLTARGNSPLQPMLAKITAATTTQELLRVAAEISVTGPNLLVGFGVGADARNATRNVLYAISGALTLPAASYYLNEAVFASVEPPFRKYIRTILSLADVSTTVVNAATVVITLEKKVAAVSLNPNDARDMTKSYFPLTYADAVANYPLAFGAWADSVELLKQSALATNSTIVFRSLAYFEGIEKLLASTSLPDLRLYLAYLCAHSFAPYLGEPFLQARFAFFGQTLNGLRKPAARSRVCTSAETTFLPHPIGQLYYAKVLDTNRTEQVWQMVTAVERAMATRIATLDWLDDATRAQAQAKLQRVANLIGRSTSGQQYRYPFARLNRTDYVGNVMALNSHSFNRSLAKIATPVDRTEWAFSAAEANAYYSPWQNTMVFPAAILQPPFFVGGDGVQAAQNFGAVATVIGHELTHGFDNNGRKYDGTGSLREWWTRDTAMRFDARAQCLKTQYSAYEVTGERGSALGTVDGNATLSENMADNGGVRLALDAFRQYWRAHNDPAAASDEAERLFFVAFGHVWCSKARDAFVRQQLLTREPHAPSKWRVNGVVQNSRAFARAFQCASESPMNPTTKCEVW